MNMSKSHHYEATYSYCFLRASGFFAFYRSLVLLHSHLDKVAKSMRKDDAPMSNCKNDKNNKMLTRIKGIAFSSQKELEDYIKLLEEAEKRDHRRISKEMGLFMLKYILHSERPIYVVKWIAVMKKLVI